MAGKVSEAFETLKDYILSTHIHDNTKDRDSHLWPSDGTIDWKEAMELLRSAPKVPPLLLKSKGKSILIRWRRCNRLLRNWMGIKTAEDAEK